MTKPKLLKVIFFLAAFTLSALVFLQLSNDHKECDTIDKTDNVSGTLYTSTEHVCNELFSM